MVGYGISIIILNSESWLILCFYAPFEEGGTYCFAHVGLYVGIPEPCATSNSERFAT